MCLHHHATHRLSLFHRDELLLLLPRTNQSITLSLGLHRARTTYASTYCSTTTMHALIHKISTSNLPLCQSQSSSSRSTPSKQEVHSTPLGSVEAHSASGYFGKEIRVQDDATKCMMKDLLQSLKVDVVETNNNTKGGSGFSHLKEVFQSRILEYYKAYHEDEDDVPEGELPRLFHQPRHEPSQT